MKVCRTIWGGGGGMGNFSLFNHSITHLSHYPRGGGQTRTKGAECPPPPLKETLNDICSISFCIILYRFELCFSKLTNTV